MITRRYVSASLARQWRRAGSIFRLSLLSLSLLASALMLWHVQRSPLGSVAQTHTAFPELPGEAEADYPRERRPGAPVVYESRDPARQFGTHFTQDGLEKLRLRMASTFLPLLPVPERARTLMPTISFCDVPTVLPKITGLPAYSPALCFQYSGLSAETYTLKAYLLQGGLPSPPCRSTQWCGDAAIPPSVFQINNAGGNNSAGTIPIVRAMDVFDDTTGAGFLWVIDLHNQAGAVVASAVQTASATANRAPTLNAIGDRTGTAGQSLGFGVTASDPEGDALSLTAQNLPPGATFNGATGLFQWPSPTAGTYPNVLFKAAQIGAIPLSDAELITIQINGGPQTLALSASAYVTGEGGPAIIVVTRNDNVGAVSVQYATANLTATAGADYAAAAGTLNFAAGETRKAIAVSLNNDAQIEPNETFSFTLSNPVGAVLGTPTAAVVTITDDDTPSVAGQWSGVMNWPVVPIHMSLLPNGKVLFWDRHDHMEGWDGTPHLWEPATNTFTMLASPGYDVFCSGHSFMADGKLLVTGGHISMPPPFDSGVGEDKTSLFDPQTNVWAPLPPMNAGRWYPSNVTLANGDVLTLGGTKLENNAISVNTLPQVWQAASGAWRNLTGALQGNPPDWADYYPFLYLAPNGRVFNAGPQRLARYLDTSGAGAWINVANSSLVYRDYGSSVMYDDGKVLIVGGNPRDPNANAPTILPSDSAEVINLAAAQPAWRTVPSPAVGRRHHNATLLPDGKVLVTGGSALPGFDNPAGGVFFAEQWNPAGESWQPLAGYTRYRGYHSNALLLPDGRVLIAGGGHPNPPGGMAQTNIEIYSPPYLFNGPRPTIAAAPAQVAYGQSFFVQTPDGASIANVNWIRLGSVTHGFDQNQRINRLSFTATAGGLNITTPANPNLCPPGHYLLFTLNGNGVPSVARIVQLIPSACSYSIMPTSRHFDPGAGAGCIAVTTQNNCAWNAVSNEAWITITSGASGNGNGTVCYTVASNTGPTRSGAISVASQTFIITQAAPTIAFSAVSAGFFVGSFAEFSRDGVSFYHQSGVAGRGFNVAAIDRCTRQLREPVRNFDTWGSRDNGTAHDQLRAFLQSQPNGTLLLIAVGDEAGLTQFDNCTPLGGVWVENLYQALEALGSTQIRSYCYRDSWALITVKGAGAANAEHLNHNGQAIVQTMLTAPITINPSNLPSGFVSTTYSQTLMQTGGVGAINWSVSSGALPGGLSLGATTGVLLGTPSAHGTFNFTVRATDANNCFGERSYTVVISGNGLMYYPLPRPIRLFDTRAPIPGFPACEYLNQPLAADGELVRQARITCDGITIPAGAQAIVGNATVVAPSGGGFITLWPNGQPRPPVSNLNYTAGQVVPNAFTVGLGTDGTFRIYSFASTHFIVDVTGYFAPPGAGGLYYHPLPRPIRLFDTRAPIPGFPACEYLNQPLAADAELARQARITCDGITIPSDAQAIVGNATVVGPSGNGFVTLWPNGQARPPVSNLNYSAGQVVPNAFTVGLGSDGQFRVYSFASTHFIVDVTGYYSPSPTDANGAGLLYSPLAKPIRLFDTRAPIPGFPACEYLNQPLAADSELAKQARVTCDGITIPASALAIVGNATVVAPSGGGFITLWPNGPPRPPVSNLNYVAGQVVPNGFTVGLGADGQFRTYSFAQTHFIVDLTGYFAP